MLTGDMGNQTMSYNGWTLLPELIRRGQWYRLFREIKSSGHRWRYMLRHCTIAPFIPVPIFGAYKRWRRGDKPPWYNHSAVHPEFGARSGIVDRAAQENSPFDSPPDSSGREVRIVDRHCTVVTADWFAKVRSQYNIDVRMPAFDRRIFEFCVAIPEDQYLRNGQDRWLIRRVMKGRLPEIIINGNSSGDQAADWFPRLTRERNLITTELERFSQNRDVASILDLTRLTAMMKNWPDREPPDYSPEVDPYRLALPVALGAAYYIEHITGSNFGRVK